MYHQPSFTYPFTLFLFVIVISKIGSIVTSSLFSHRSRPPTVGWGPSVGTFCRCPCCPPPAGGSPDWSSDSGPRPAAGLRTGIYTKDDPGWRRCPLGLRGHWSRCVEEIQWINTKDWKASSLHFIYLATCILSHDIKSVWLYLFLQSRLI